MIYCHGPILLSLLLHPFATMLLAFLFECGVSPFSTCFLILLTSKFTFKYPIRPNTYKKKTVR